MLYDAARALNHCVQGLRSNIVTHAKTVYSGADGESKLLLAALECLRAYGRDRSFDPNQVQETFAGTPLGEHPDFVWVVSETD
ncbi:MAG: hypothetical protein U0835_05110 [Isosphaeraceae bacterium]